MKWKEITINTADEGTEIVLAALDALGIQQASIVQGSDEIERLLRSTEKYWDYASDAVLGKQPAVQAYISDLPQNENIEQRVKEAMDELKKMRDELGVELGSLDVFTRIVDEEDWANNWKAYFKPLPIGEKLIVCPSWEDVSDEDGRAKLMIDPGMAFGTGTHHTTKMCLELIEENIKQGDRIADLGCGSGILSIAAALMGADEVTAVDIDPVAARIAEENAELNGIDAGKYRVLTGDILTDDALLSSVKAQKYDLVLANIVANVLIAFAPVMKALLAPNGKLIASGIIDDRLDEVIAAFKTNGLKAVEIRSGDDWRAVLAENA